MSDDTRLERAIEQLLFNKIASGRMVGFTVTVAHEIMGLVRNIGIPDVAQPEKVPPFPAALEKTFEDHYWDSFQADRELILQHIRAVLREYQICTAMARASQPPAAPVETTRLDVAKAIDPGAAWGMVVERDSPANERILQALAKADAALAVSRSSAVKAEVSIVPMALADGRADYFVQIKVGDRAVTPHVFREEYKSAYHVALYDWLLNGNGEEPDCVEFGPNDWPGRVMPDVPQRASDTERDHG